MTANHTSKLDDNVSNKPETMLNNLPLNPVGPLTSNGRLLNVHIRPLDVQKGRSMEV